MVYGCLFDLLRLVLLCLALMCVVLFGATLWLGPNYATVAAVTVTPDVQLDVDIRGPSPDFSMTVVRHVLFRETFQHLITIRIRAVPLALTTIFLSIVAWTLDWRASRGARP